jgi:hypothetical protein
MTPTHVAIFALAPLLVLGCRERNLDEVRMRGHAVVYAGDIAQRPSAYYGQTVTVVAEVEAVHGPTAFTLDDDHELEGADVLVIVPKVARQVAQADQVTVHGTVRPLDVAELNRDYTWFDIHAYDAELLKRFRQRPVIIADSIRDDQGGDLIVGAVRRPTAVN